MDAIAKALNDAFLAGSINKSLNNNFVCVTVYPNGTVDYLSDNKSGATRDEDKIAPIKQALADAGISEDDLKAYASEEESWQYGYTVMYDFNNKTMYYLNTSKGDKNGQISYQTWLNKNDKIIKQYKIE